MKLPYGANEDDFEKYKKIVSEFTNNDKNLDESTLEIMNIAYSTGGDYSDEILLEYVKAYFNTRLPSKYYESSDVLNF